MTRRSKSSRCLSSSAALALFNQAQARSSSTTASSAPSITSLIVLAVDIDPALPDAARGQPTDTDVARVNAPGVPRAPRIGGVQPCAQMSDPWLRRMAVG